MKFALALHSLQGGDLRSARFARNLATRLESTAFKAERYSTIVQVGQEYVFTIRDPDFVGPNAIGVSYDAFVDDIQVGGQQAVLLLLMQPMLSSQTLQQQNNA